MNLKKTADCVNILGRFCGLRDVPRLDQVCLLNRFGIRRADVLILFGGSILSGGDVAAAAMNAGVADSFMICGGEGHTTETLRQNIRAVYPDIKTDGKAEADLFSAYILKKYGIAPDFVERKSTNCGNNILFSLEIIRQHMPGTKYAILIQDATMQRRMDAGFRKYAAAGVGIINYAGYSAEIDAGPDGLEFRNHIAGMWTPEQYIRLLMGEIPRLSDDSDGYGPHGAGFIAHVDIPAEVLTAFTYLKRQYQVREANPVYAVPR